MAKPYSVDLRRRVLEYIEETADKGESAFQSGNRHNLSLDSSQKTKWKLSPLLKEGL